VIRSCIPSDHPWIRELAADAYADLGDYGRIIPSWLDHPGVLAYVDQSDDERGELRGFVLLGFYQPEESDPRHVADLLALAVAPAHRRQGVGRRLVRHAIWVARLAGRDADVAEMRLTVADGNVAGLALYHSFGFRVLEGDHGHYDGGQVAVRMVLGLGDAAAAAQASGGG